MSIIGSWQWFVPRLPVPAIFTHMALRWLDKRLVFDSWQRGAPSFFTPCVTLFAPTPRSVSQGFCPRERALCISRAPTRAFFGTRQMRPVTMEGESRLPAASTTSGISTLSTNDLVFHTVLCISWSLLPVKGVDFTFFNVRAKNFTFSHLCYEFKKLVMSTSDNINYCVYFQQNKK